MTVVSATSFTASLQKGRPWTSGMLVSFISISQNLLFANLYYPGLYIVRCNRCCFVSHFLFVMMIELRVITVPAQDMDNVPEAAVDENAGAVFRQDDVGGAGESFPVDAVAVSELEQLLTQLHFRLRVMRLDV